MTTVCIVGAGLIGGSLGMALRRVRRGGKRVFRVVGWGRSAARLRQAKKRGALDDFSLNPRTHIPTSDIVVLCVPVQFTVSVAKKLVPHMKSKAVLTDVGSVKESVNKDMKTALSQRKDLFWVGGHPVAGSEKAGVAHAKADLFKGAWCVLTNDGAKKPALQKIQSLWRSVGARCLVLPARRHDKILALISHLPHLLSFALFSLVMKENKKDARVALLSAGSLRDMTRIAAADPHVWDGILSHNRMEIKKTVAAFSSTLRALSGLSGAKRFNALTALSRAKK